MSARLSQRWTDRGQPLRLSLPVRFACRSAWLKTHTPMGMSAIPQISRPARHVLRGVTPMRDREIVLVRGDGQPELRYSSGRDLFR